MLKKTLLLTAAPFIVEKNRVNSFVYPRVSQ